MEKLGIIIDRPARSQKFYKLATELNKLVSPNRDIIVFYLENGWIPVETKFSLMEAYYSFQYDGILISTDIKTTEILNNNLNARKKLFYVWDLEWMTTPNLFPINNNAYNGAIDLIARSQSHFDILKKVWKEPKNIIEDFNHEKIREL